MKIAIAAGAALAVGIAAFQADLPSTHPALAQQARQHVDDARAHAGLQGLEVLEGLRGLESLRTLEELQHLDHLDHLDRLDVIDHLRVLDHLDVLDDLEDLGDIRYLDDYRGPGDHVSWDDCDYRDERSLDASTDGIGMLAIGSGSGGLRVEGRENVSTVSVEAELCASDQDLLDDLDVRFERQSDRLILDTFYPERDNRSWWDGDRYARIELVVVVPIGMALGIDDGSGSIEVSHVGSLVIHDGSGSIDVFDVRGDVRIDDGSGEVVLREVAGTVEIEDGSGPLRVEDVRGDVDIDDGSGELEVVRVQGDVTVDDGSGEVRVTDVGRSVTVSDSSGSIRVRDVRGDFRVRRDGSGSIDHSNVAGTVDLPRRR
ncbi:MAG TPA: DUF4097 family beta strand repeat-containing protein [Longimicrobiales bacterium]|nr:DUF4097 family beta strand repeat-containing protein [Longimicrobiales bacterium]